MRSKGRTQWTWSVPGTRGRTRVHWLRQSAPFVGGSSPRDYILANDAVVIVTDFTFVSYCQCLQAQDVVIEGEHLTGSKNLSEFFT